jgi:hypothetical protein
VRRVRHHYAWARGLMLKWAPKNRPPPATGNGRNGLQGCRAGLVTQAAMISDGRSKSMRLPDSLSQARMWSTKRRRSAACAWRISPGPNVMGLIPHAPNSPGGGLAPAVSRLETTAGVRAPPVRSLWRLAGSGGEVGPPKDAESGTLTDLLPGGHRPAVWLAVDAGARARRTPSLPGPPERALAADLLVLGPHVVRSGLEFQTI